MSVLAKIRTRAGLLVAIVGIALFSFVLGDFLTSSNHSMMKNDDRVAIIGDHEVKINEYGYKIEEALGRYKQQSQEAAIDEQVKEMIGGQVWEQMVNEYVLKKEINKVGVTVSEDELYDQMLGRNPHPYIVQIFTNRETGRIREDFATPAGQLDVAKIADYIRNISGQGEQEWIGIENVIRNSRLESKYYNLIKKGLYTTTAEAKRSYNEENKSVKIRYVMKRFAMIADTAASVTEDDAKKYYNTHQSEFSVKQPARKIEYVAFTAIPTKEDTDAIKNDLASLVEEFKTKKTKEDSSFVARESDSHYVDNMFRKKGGFTPLIDSLLFDTVPGTVLGPFIDNNSIKLAKLEEFKMSPDSVKARHILIKIMNNDTIRATALADSIKKAVNAKNFEALAKKYSQDPGSGEKGGDLGWFDEGQMVPEFSKACFEGKKGDIVQVQSKFGFHIIEITEKGTEMKKVMVRIIDRVIVPGSKTLTKYYQEASQFAGKSTTKELFDKAVKEESLDKRSPNEIKAGDKTIPGLENPRELIRWAFEAEAGEVSAPLDLGNKFIVAQLVYAVEKGIAPFEAVKDMATEGAKKEKKVQIITEEFNKAMATEKNIDALAAKMDEQVFDVDDVKFSMNSIAGVGREGALIGAASALKPGALSQPVVGRNGVMVILVQEVKEAPALTDFTANKNKMTVDQSGRVDSDVYDALKDASEIVDNRVRFGF